MDNVIAVTLKDVYGAVKAYPANEQAERLASLVGTKTLTVATLRSAAAMGFTLRYIDRFGAAETWSADAFALRIA